MGQYRVKNSGDVEAFQWDGSNQQDVVDFVYKLYGVPIPENVVLNGDGSISIDTASTIGTVVVPLGEYFVRLWERVNPGGWPITIVENMGIMTEPEFNNAIEDNEG